MGAFCRLHHPHHTEAEQVKKKGYDEVWEEGVGVGLNPQSFFQQIQCSDIDGQPARPHVGQTRYMESETSTFACRYVCDVLDGSY